MDFESQRLYSIRVRATDTGELTLEKPFNISVLNLNETPTSISLSPAEVNEGLAIGATVGALSTTDVDFGDKHKYELVNNAAETFDFDSKSSYRLDNQVIDRSTNGPTQSLVVTDKDANESITDLNLSSCGE